MKKVVFKWDLSRTIRLPSFHEDVSDELIHYAKTEYVAEFFSHKKLSELCTQAPETLG